MEDLKQFLEGTGQRVADIIAPTPDIGQVQSESRGPGLGSSTKIVGSRQSWRDN
jgi:hypothetical protein